MAILLTGSSGFVGAYVRRRIDCLPLARDGQEIDLRNADEVADVVHVLKPEAVIHLAAQSFVPASFRNPRETLDINFTGTLNLLSALRSCAFRGRMLFIGSGDAYGLVDARDLPITEDHPLRPRSPYAVSKVAAEALCYQWSQTEGLDIVMTRPFNHIGAGQSPQFAVSDFARQIIEIKRGQREPLLRVGDIDVTRDFTDVRDVVSAYLLLLHAGRRGETYNVCSGVERSLRSILTRLLDLADVDARIEMDADRMRPSEQRRICGSHDKLQRETGWKPATDFDRSLVDILDHWKEQGS